MRRYVLRKSIAYTAVPDGVVLTVCALAIVAPVSAASRKPIAGFTGLRKRWFRAETRLPAGLSPYVLPRSIVLPAGNMVLAAINIVR
jgi:hypothetical protein